MSSNGCTYRFIKSTLSGSTDQIQQPQRAKVSLINERDRRSIEPPPILQLHWRNCSEDELKKCLQSPFYFIVANLVTEDDTETPLVPVQNYLSGTTVSSLYRLRDIDNSEVKSRIARLSCPTHSLYIYQSNSLVLSKLPSSQELSLIKVRKRKSDAATKEVAEHKRVTKQYHSKHIDMMVASSSHLEPVNNSNSDVFFGKWQVASRTPHPRPSTLLPSTLNNANCSDDHLQSFPSPESTPPYRPEHAVHRPIPMRETSYKPSSPHVASIPPYRSSISSPPFKSVGSPSNSSLAQYHTCHDSHSQPLSAVKRLPTPPSCFSEIPREKHWGTTLPPLRAIMNSADPFHSETSSLFPLLLPPPSTRIMANKPFYPHY
ncbi:hypothetical protein EDC96DRAFT_450074 [Choanephora cucurbitarum]|nr:hypothetical protein EDC96DRAFT_450074 [Choanephora cucurbitarum]